MLRMFCYALGFAAVLGCSSSPPQSDPAMAHKLMVDFLTAWQKGQSAEDFKKSSPDLTVIEDQWTTSTKLINYELPAAPKPSGFDQQFQVKLTLQKDGKTISERAFYALSTSPKKIIVRYVPG